MLQAIVWFHRWLGVATCLIFAAWFASGAVLLFQPFPSMPHATQMALQAPVGGVQVMVAPAQAVMSVGGNAQDLRLVQRAGRPAYLVGTADGIRAIDASTGALLPILSPQQAWTEARRVFGQAASVAGQFDYDQLVVHDRFDPARPFYRLDGNDAAGTQLYLSARTGEFLQLTTRSARAWNWPGAVLHWIYVTPLRKSWSAWDSTVWWLSLVCMLVAVAGTVLGVVRMLAAGRLCPPRLTFFRQRWLRWHHLLGLGTAVFVLGWIFSGWLSMDHGRLFSRGIATGVQAEHYAGCSIADALHSVRTMVLQDHDGAREIDVTILACRPVLTRYGGDGNVVRVDRNGFPLDEIAMRHLIGRAAMIAWSGGPVAYIAPVDPTSTYALAEGWPASAWRVAFNASSLPDLYVDGKSGRLLTVMSSSRAVYAWVYYAVHTGNVPGLSSRPILRRIVVLIPLAAGFVFSISGVVLGWKRLRRMKPRR